MNTIDYDGLKGLLASPDLDLSELDSLSDSERQILLQMANEFSSRGSSNTLKSLWSEDYDEVPVDIDTFLDDPHYFGEVLDGSVYPYWRKMLREIFAPDSKYFEVIFSCLTGDTKIPCLDGRVRTIKEIVNLVNKGEVIYVYSFDREKQEYTVGKVVNGVMNGCRTTFEVTLDNGKSFNLTGDHKVLMRDNTWKEAKDLKIGDSLMPFDNDIVNIESINHIVKKIDYNAMLLPVYDIEIETCHNFALDAGCIVKNCSIGR